MKIEEWPSVGELVVVKIKQILPGTGVKAELLEYPGKEAFIHISQVARSWVKNIRSFVSVGAIRVAYVERVRPREGIINISLRKVSPQQQKRRLDDWKREKRADKMFEAICKGLGEDFSKSYHKIAVPLIEEYGDLLAAFENIKLHGKDAFEGLKIPKKWQDALIEFADKNITLSKVILESNVKLSFKTGDGADKLKKVLGTLEDKGLRVIYVGAPNYKVRMESVVYQNSEEEFKKLLSDFEKTVKKNGGEISYSEPKPAS